MGDGILRWETEMRRENGRESINRTEEENAGEADDRKIT